MGPARREERRMDGNGWKIPAFGKEMEKK